MNAVLASGAATGCACMFWTIAASAGRRRGIPVGAFPLALPAAVAAAAALGAMFGANAPAIAALAGVAVAGWIDYRTGFIFDPLSASVFGAALLLRARDHGAVSALGDAVALGAALFVLYALTRGRGIGLGDVKLAAAIGAGFGAGGGFAALAIAFVIGGTVATWLLVTKRARAGTAIRFGPFLAAGAFAAVLGASAPLP